MRAAEVLDAQIDLLEKLNDKLFGDQIAFLFAHHTGAITVSEDINKMAARLEDFDMEQFNYIPSVFANQVKVASAYRVTYDMSMMIEWTASQLDENDKFFRQLLPTEAGIVCLDRPLQVRDVRGKQMLIHWIVWGPGEGGTMMWTFNDPLRQPDEVNTYFRKRAMEEYKVDSWEAFEKATGRWSTIGVSILHDGTNVGKPLWSPSPRQIAEIVEEGFEPVEGTNILRYFQALIMLLNQTVTSVTDETVERPARRRAVKKGIPPRVSVIKLRRNDSDGRLDGESEVEWQHRWIVRRHWRWQPYGRRLSPHAGDHTYGEVEPDEGSLVRHCSHQDCDHVLKRIIIDAYVKGPEGAPIIQSEKLYSLER